MNVISQVGNYGEIYDRTVGADAARRWSGASTPSSTDGGLLYAPPYR